jgi:hypothetical protein
MRLNPFLTVLAALVAVAVLLSVAGVVLNPAGPVLEKAEFSLNTITPNADGQTDATSITYHLRRSATVSIYFLDKQNTRYNFRTENARDPGDHSLLFSGIVDAYSLPGDNFSAKLLRRVLQNGDYTWVIEAQEGNAAPTQIKGNLTVTDADTSLPDLKNLTASPTLFSPNQDGIDDRVTINVWLDKEIPDTNLRMALIAASGEEFPIAEGATNILPGRKGLHTYDYDGGIDTGLNPPDNGDYTVRATVEDTIGQSMEAEVPLAIKNGGFPRAEISLGKVTWSSHSVPIGTAFTFSLVVSNYGTAPIRTFGPWSGTQYKQSENSNSLGETEQDGAWRIGIDCDSCIRDYPWRWGLGTPDTLTKLDENGATYYYLMPGDNAVVTGSVVLTDVIDSRNPQYFWAGLIHEAVGIDTINNHVDPWQVTIEKP